MIFILIQLLLAQPAVPADNRPNAPVLHRADGALQPYRLIDIAPARPVKFGQ